MRWAALSLAAFLLALLTRALGAPEPVQWALFATCYAAGGWEPALAGLQALREKTLDVDLLMIVAALGAAAIGQVLDGRLLIAIFATSGALEAVATKRTRDAVRSLLTLAPEDATRLRADGTEEVVETATLLPGDLMLVRPAERIGADGVVEDGQRSRHTPGGGERHPRHSSRRSTILVRRKSARSQTAAMISRSWQTANALLNPGVRRQPQAAESPRSVRQLPLSGPA